MGRNKITLRIEVNINLKDMIGKVLITNLFPTFRGKLLYTQDGKCYFELLENKNYPKYNQCAGQIEYLPERLVITSNFENK
jgi:hypothetical protein